MNGLNDIIAQDAKEAGKWACNRNLLDNWYFGNPANQNGKTEYTKIGYTIDRWKFEYYDALCRIDTNWLVLKKTESLLCLTQNLDPALISVLRGKTITISALADMGCVSLSFPVPLVGEFGTRLPMLFNDGTFWVMDVVFSENNASVCARFVNDTDCPHELHLTAAKLELGPVQTLAHKEGDTWVLNEVPDYGEELRKYQAYYWESEMAFESNTVVENNHLLCNVRFPVAMRIIPKVTILANDKTENAISGWATGAVVLKDVHVNGVTLTKEGFNALYSDSGFTPGETYSFKVRADANP